jgi:hypothetical protein
MKHSKKEKCPCHSQGFARGMKANLRQLKKGPSRLRISWRWNCPSKKEDLSAVRGMVVKTDPTNKAAPTIKRCFRPLNNPTKILEVLQATLIIKADVAGNNVITGSN